MESTIPNSTTFPASNRNDQLAYPFGGDPWGDDPGFRLAVEDLRHWRCLAPLPLQGSLEPSLDKILADVLDRLRPARKRLRDLPVGPGRPVRIRLQQNLGAANPLAGTLQPADRFVADVAFLGRQPDDVFLVHGSAFL